MLRACSRWACALTAVGAATAACALWAGRCGPRTPDRRVSVTVSCGSRSIDPSRSRELRETFYFPMPSSNTAHANTEHNSRSAAHTTPIQRRHGWLTLTTRRCPRATDRSNRTKRTRRALSMLTRPQTAGADHSRARSLSCPARGRRPTYWNRSGTTRAFPERSRPRTRATTSGTCMGFAVARTRQRSGPLSPARRLCYR